MSAAKTTMTKPRTRGLSRAAIIDTAETLIDRDGWQQLTMTGLANTLGIQVPSLYSHVENLEAVLAGAQAHAHTMLATRLGRAAMGRSREQGFRALADVLRAFAAEHGGLYDLAMRAALDEPAVLAASEPSGAALVAVIESFGIREPTLDLQMSCLATLHGVIALDRSGIFGGMVDASAAYERGVAMIIDELEREGS